MKNQTPSQTLSIHFEGRRQWLTRAAVLSATLFPKWGIPILGICLVLAVGGSAEAQTAGFIYVADAAHSSVDVLRASDHVRIASMPTIQNPYGVAVTGDGKRIYVSTFDSKTIYTF